MVDEPVIKNRIAELYQESFAALMEHGYPKELIEAQQEATASDPQPPPSPQAPPRPPTPIGEVPLMLFVFNKGDSTGSSSYPAVWSAMLAARGEGVGSVLTAVLSFRQHEIFETIGVPKDEGWMMAACITMGYPVAKFSIARRPSGSSFTVTRDEEARPGARHVGRDHVDGLFAPAYSSRAIDRSTVTSAFVTVIAERHYLPSLRGGSYCGATSASGTLSTVKLATAPASRTFWASTSGAPRSCRTSRRRSSSRFREPRFRSRPPTRVKN